MILLNSHETANGNLPIARAEGGLFKSLQSVHAVYAFSPSNLTEQDKRYQMTTCPVQGQRVGYQADAKCTWRLKLYFIFDCCLSFQPAKLDSLTALQAAAKEARRANGEFLSDDEGDGDGFGAGAAVRPAQPQVTVADNVSVPTLPCNCKFAVVLRRQFRNR